MFHACGKNFPPVFHHGWNINYEVEWIKDAFPEDVSLLLINEDDDIEEIGTDDESDSDEYLFARDYYYLPI